MKEGDSCVWASCCGLLNEVMGAGAVRGQQPGFGGVGPFRFSQSAGYSTHTYPYTYTHPQSHTHRQTHTSPHSHTLSCQSCRERFSMFRKRYVCSDCGRSFCSVCSVLQVNLRLCSTCSLLKETAFHRSRLMKLRIRDLRLYLTLHNINTNTCREKEDLVNLVLFHQGVENQEDSDMPTFSTSPAYTTPTAGYASQFSFAQEESINRQDGLGSTNEQHVDSASLFPLDPTVQTPEVAQRAGRASLSDLLYADEVEQLSVRQLKEILSRNLVTFSGCCEKWELVERVRRLYTDRENNHKSMESVCVGADSSQVEVVDDNLCRICMDALINCVLLECGHMVTCTKCGKRMSECPICRQYVIRAVHVFRA